MVANTNTGDSAVVCAEGRTVISSSAKWHSVSRAKPAPRKSATAPGRTPNAKAMEWQRAVSRISPGMHAHSRRVEATASIPQGR